MLRALCLVAVVVLGGAGAAAFAGERPQPLFTAVQLRSPTWSPDEKRIAFAREVLDATGGVVHSALWLVGDKGGTARRLTARRYLASGPAWSPGGRLLAYVARRRGSSTSELRLLDLKARRARTLLATSEYLSGPAWSPRGDRLAVVVGEQLVTVDVRSAATAKMLVWGSRPTLAWGRNGLIALATQRSVVTFNPATGERFRVTGTAIFEMSFVAPAWSPDGEWLAFTIHDYSGSRVVRAAYPGTSYAVVAPRGMDPAWSPRRARLAFATPNGWRKSQLRVASPQADATRTLPLRFVDT